MTTPQALVIEVHLPGGRFHGKRRIDSDRRKGNATEAEEWPPSPFRLFQALVAAAYGGRWVAEDPRDKDAALRWLERLDAPIIAAPAASALSPVTAFVPNNDLDAVGGDPARIAEIRIPKVIRSMHFDGTQPLLYAWPLKEASDHAGLVTEIAARLHTLGHGIDQAFASASIVDQDTVDARLERHAGSIARPAEGAEGGEGLACPAPGSLDSLKSRHAGAAARFVEQRSGRTVTVEFRQPPKAMRRTVAYDRPDPRLVFELRNADRPAQFLAWLHTGAAALAKAVRDVAFDQLVGAFPERREELDRLVCGRSAGRNPPHERIQFIPLPSIGIGHTSPSIRRVLVRIPAGSPLSVADLRWSLAGRTFGGTVDGDGVVSGSTLLVPTEADRMVERYTGPGTVWRTVTPVVLPHAIAHGRSDGARRLGSLDEAASAVLGAMRHAGIAARVSNVRVQPEPFLPRGVRSSEHDGDRFGPARLGHVEITTDRPLSGPVVLGDGRWLGLGLMFPVRQTAPTRHVLRIDGPGLPAHRAVNVSQAARRAVMARAQQVIGHSPLPLFFTGHAEDGSPAGRDGHRHLFFLADDADGDGLLDRLVIVAPRASEVDDAAHYRRDLATLAQAVAGFHALRAGPDGVLSLSPVAPEPADPLLGSGRVWVSRTNYVPTRQPKRDHAAAIGDDVRSECHRHGLRRPSAVDVLDVAIGPRGGVSARVRLRFASVVRGPLLLGADAHFGRCLFTAENAARPG